MLLGMALLGIAAASTDRRHALRCKRVGNLRCFLASQAVSQSGTWLQFLALAWLASELTGSGTALGWITVATFGPLLVLGPWTGAFADRVDKHRLLIATQFLIVCQAAVLGAVVLVGASTVSMVYGLTIAFGLLHAVETPVRRAFVAELVDEDRIQHAVGLTGAITAIGRLIGTLCAGALIAWAGVGWCFVATAVGYLIALTTLLRHASRRAPHHRGGTRTRGGAGGPPIRWRVPELRITLSMTAILATFGFNHQVLVPLLANHTFDGGVGAYTLLYTAIGVGSVFGALAVARHREIDMRFLAGAIIAFGLANGLLALSPNLALAAVAGVATGVTASLFVTASTALLGSSAARLRCAGE